MDSDAVLLNITKLENGNVRNGLRGVDNPALDLTTVVADDKKLAVNGHGDDSISLDRVTGSRNYESIKVEWKNLTFTVKSGKGALYHHEPKSCSCIRRVTLGNWRSFGCFFFLISYFAVSV